MKDEYDFVVIGGGSAGFAGATAAAHLGLDTALVEGADTMGGLCILRGCMPSKTLIESANRYYSMRRAREFGLEADHLGVRPEEIIARKERLVEEFAAHRRKQLAAGPFDLIRGWARFVDPNTIEISGEENRRIRAKAFLIATGSSVKIVEVPGLADTGFLDSDRVLESATLPKSLIVLGGGAIAMEFAHYYSALGSQVTVIQRGRQVLRGMDGDVAVAVSDALCERGVTFHLGATLKRVEKAGSGGKRVVFNCEGDERSVEAEEILYALGRTANVDKLGLESAGVAVQHGRLSVNMRLQTAAPNIFAAGDAAGSHEIVHIAITQAELAARNAARLIGNKSDPMETADYRLKLFVVFTEPQVAALGFTEQELMTANAPYSVARHAFSDHGKAMVMGETHGFVKLIANPGNCEILGAAVVGPEAGELIHELSAAMYFHATAQDLLRIPHYHPTLSEIWTYPAEELALTNQTAAVPQHAAP